MGEDGLKEKVKKKTLKKKLRMHTICCNFSLTPHSYCPMQGNWECGRPVQHIHSLSDCSDFPLSIYLFNPLHPLYGISEAATSSFLDNSRHIEFYSW